jgi:hypothetical protein
MLALAIRRQNARVKQLREEIKADPSRLDLCLSERYAFMLKDKNLAYELLLDVDSFVFETRSLYEIMGKFLISLFQLLFDRKITEQEIQSLLSAQGIDTRWVEELRETRKLFFHETAPWLAVQVDRSTDRFDPVFMKKNIISFENAGDFVEFATLRQIYDGLVGSLTELHRFIKEQIRLAESGSRVA